MHPFCSRITKVYEIYSHFDRFIASTIFVFLHILSGVFFFAFIFLVFIQFTLITFTFALALNIIFLSLPLRSFYHIQMHFLYRHLRYFASKREREQEGEERTL